MLRDITSMVLLLGQMGYTMPQIKKICRNYPSMDSQAEMYAQNDICVWPRTCNG